MFPPEKQKGHHLAQVMALVDRSFALGYITLLSGHRLQRQSQADARNNRGRHY